jgi:hypothetical protein
VADVVVTDVTLANVVVVIIIIGVVVVVVVVAVVIVALYVVVVVSVVAVVALKHHVIGARVTRLCHRVGLAEVECTQSNLVAGVQKRAQMCK